MEPQTLITIAECASYLHVSEDTVRRMIARGEVAAHRYGPRLIRIDRSSLDAGASPIGPGLGA
jgi:excisionase family DNA binding protein